MLSRIRRALATANYGCLFDGTSNLSLTGKIAHFELGYIPESAKELKARFVSLQRKARALRADFNLFQGADFSEKICFGMSKRGVSARHRFRALALTKIEPRGLR